MSLNVQSPLSEHRSNTFDFVKFYKPAAPNDSKEDHVAHLPKITPKSKGTKKDTVDSTGTDTNLDCQATSTPNASGSKIKSIMKNKQVFDFSNKTAEELSYTPKGKSKKRNKSVSFHIEASDETATKKTKSHNLSQDHTSHIKVSGTKVEKKFEKLKKKSNVEPAFEDKTENSFLSKKFDKKHSKNNDENIGNDQFQHNQKKMRSKIFRKSKEVASDSLDVKKNPDAMNSIEKMNVEDTIAATESMDKTKKKHKNKNKQNHKTETSEIINDGLAPSDSQIIVIKKKKNHSNKRVMGAAVKVDGEPVTKSRKTDQTEDAIAEKIESLSIGDTPHSLTNLIDEMTVSDKNARKKVRKQFKKVKSLNSVNSDVEPPQNENIAKKEKIKWTKRKWNKGLKAEIKSTSTVIIEKLSITLMLNYKQLLTDHFGQYGPIKKIGVAELYPSETLQPSFATTIEFFDNETAMKALEDDNMLFHGQHIRILPPLPPTMTTLVVRSFGELNDQSLSSVFASAGKIRTIKHLIKGRHSIGTSFVEFDGPEAVESALKVAETSKIGGKRLHVSKYEERERKIVEDNPEVE